MPDINAELQDINLKKKIQIVRYEREKPQFWHKKPQFLFLLFYSVAVGAWWGGTELWEVNSKFGEKKSKMRDVHCILRGNFFLLRDVNSQLWVYGMTCSCEKKVKFPWWKKSFHKSAGMEEGTSSLIYLETESWLWYTVTLHESPSMSGTLPFLFSVRWVSVYAHTCCHVYVHMFVSANQSKMCLFGSAYAPETKYARIYLD